MLKGKRTRKRIIAKAAALFNRKGFGGCSMQDISAATGLEKGSLYTHFRTKEELAAEAFDYAWSETCAASVGNLGDVSNSVDKLKLHIDNVATKPSFAGGCPMLNTALDSDDGNLTLRRRAESAIRGWVGLLAGLVRDGQLKKEIRSSVDPEGLATLIISLLEGASASAKLQRSPLAMKLASQHLKEHLDTHVRLAGDEKG
jgi:TetR/AcrR family transcriptional regulator, transcriptional repressor for nem operon